MPQLQESTLHAVDTVKAPGQTCMTPVTELTCAIQVLGLPGSYTRMCACILQLQLDSHISEPVLQSCMHISCIYDICDDSAQLFCTKVKLFVRCSSFLFKFRAHSIQHTNGACMLQSNKLRYLLKLQSAAAPLHSLSPDTVKRPHIDPADFPEFQLHESLQLQVSYSPSMVD